MAPARHLAGQASSSACPAPSARKRGRPRGPSLATRKYSDEFERRVCEAYLTGESCSAIARRFRIPPTTVGKIAKRNGIQRTRAGDIKQQIIAAYQPGVSIADIARLANASRAYVSIILNQCGLRQFGRTDHVRT